MQAGRAFLHRLSALVLVACLTVFISSIAEAAFVGLCPGTESEAPPYISVVDVQIKSEESGEFVEPEIDVCVFLDDTSLDQRSVRSVRILPAVSLGTTYSLLGGYVAAGTQFKIRVTHTRNN